MDNDGGTKYKTSYREMQTAHGHLDNSMRLRLCGSFELALRGHDESEGSDNPGIFRGLVDFVASLTPLMEC